MVIMCSLCHETSYDVLFHRFLNPTCERCMNIALAYTDSSFDSDRDESIFDDDQDGGGEAPVDLPPIVDSPAVLVQINLPSVQNTTTPFPMISSLITGALIGYTDPVTNNPPVGIQLPNLGAINDRDISSTYNQGGTIPPVGTIFAPIWITLTNVEDIQIMRFLINRTTSNQVDKPPFILTFYDEYFRMVETYSSPLRSSFGNNGGRHVPFELFGTNAAPLAFNVKFISIDTGTAYFKDLSEIQIF
jgi:hypothetical protein